MTNARGSLTATLLTTGNVLLVGGISASGGVLGTGELYNPTAGTFSLAGNLNDARCYQTAALLSNGTVLIAGGQDANSYNLSSAELYETVVPPPPFSLQITPAIANIAVAGTQTFTAVDNLGIPRTDTTWTVSNTSLATLVSNANGTATLTGVAAGVVTLTATAEEVTAQVQVTILASGAFVPGTVIWSAAPVAGFSVQQLLQAVPSDDGPDLYSISTSADGTQSIIQALQADGEQLWQMQMSAAMNNTGVPDGFGGLIVETCASGSPMTIVDLNAAGEPLWQVQSAEVRGLGYICYPAPIAIDGSGNAWITGPTNAGLPSVTEAYPSGATGSFEFPPSIVNSTAQVQCCVGPPMVNTDGNMYVEYEVRNTSGSVITSDTLYLYNSATGLNGAVVLSSTTQNEALLPGPIIPDGNGGVLATWTISPAGGPVPQYLYQVVDVSAGVVGTPYNLPFSPTTVTFGQSPTLVLGENGIAFATDGVNTNNGPSVVSYNVSSGSTNLLYQAAAGDTLSIIEATSDGGVTISDANAGGVVQVAGTGGNPSASRIHRSQTTPASSSLLGAVPYDLGSWLSIASGAVASLWSPTGTNGIPTILAQSVAPMPHGNQQGQSLPPFCQRKNVNCALAPNADLQAYCIGNVNVGREVAYWLFSLQNGTLTPLVGTSQIQGVKIEEWEANPSNPNINSCSWQNPNTRCQSPNTSLFYEDPPGQLTDCMSAGAGASYTISQQFLVDRQGVQVFWPNSQPTWYGAWGTPASSPPGFQPNQTASVVIGWATISQINVNNNAPAACPSQCDPDTPQQGPPKGPPK